MRRRAARDRDVAARRRACQEQRSGDDAVGDDLILDAVQFAHAFDDDRIAAVPRDLRAHRAQEVGEVDDFGLHRGVLDRRRPLSQDGREHRVLRCADARHAEIDGRAAQFSALGDRDQIAVGVRNRRAERTKCLFVHVGRARAEDAAAGQRDLGAAEARQQRSDQIKRGREFSDERVRRAVRGDVRRVDDDRVRALGAQPRAERLEQRPHHRDVGDARYAVQDNRGLGQERGRHDRQCGVLGAMGLDAALERVSPTHAKRRLEPVEHVHSGLFRSAPWHGPPGSVFALRRHVRTKPARDPRARGGDWARALVDRAFQELFSGSVFLYELGKLARFAILG